MIEAKNAWRRHDHGEDDEQDCVSAKIQAAYVSDICSTAIGQPGLQLKVVCHVGGIASMHQAAKRLIK